MVYDVLARSAAPKRPIKSVSRVRFKQAIRPDDRLKILADPRKGEIDVYNFRIMIEEEVVCSGVMTLQGSPEERSETGDKAGCSGKASWPQSADLFKHSKGES